MSVEESHDPQTVMRASDTRAVAKETADTRALGRLLRDARAQRGMSLKRFAAAAEISEGLLSQFERGQGNPSLLTLQKIAAALDVPLAHLFYKTTPDEESVDTESDVLPRRQCAVVPSGGRKKLVLPQEQLVYELLTPDLQRPLEMMRCVVPPGFDGRARPFQHEGEEAVHVLEGRLRAHVADDVHDLGPGDTISLQASLPHWWANIGEVPVVVISACTPPSF
ncbi:helix-turn-helix domain-containing protein [Streptomyces lomondensis]|uniref:MerR family transcriptional regulator n=1 Tax=Streptomyces lomondensis TaxID=68229 RepID=A0ABQ2X880_9ACTN|nr:cupin domain-containing protein [Streptomyces lomondensis]MCF0082427.1 helix-turn-helix domain-containing protein [Streptomyces lomondensis]GGX04192.1 MerR family transcriptional regulator [Streptomyces lomondensis]